MSMFGEKPIEVVHFRNESLLSVSERRDRFEQEGIGLMARLGHLLRTVGKEKFDPSDNRKILREKMEAKQANLAARGGRLMVELPERLSRFLGEAVLFPPNGEKMPTPAPFITSLHLRRLEEAIMQAELFLAKLEAFEKEHPVA